MCYCLFAYLQHQRNYLSISAYFKAMNDECEPPVPKKILLLYVELFYKKICWKNRKKCARIALSAKSAPALRQMQKYAALAEKPKKCEIFVQRTIAFFPWV